jgi:hypothetical protein
MKKQSVVHLEQKSRRKLFRIHKLFIPVGGSKKSVKIEIIKVVNAIICDLVCSFKTS